MIACDCEVCRSVDPRDNRLRSSILVQSAATTLVVDSTPDFRYQMLRARVRKLDAIVFTHPHKDHIAGLDDVRAYNYFSQQPMQIYANEMTQMNIIREFPYAFAETRYPGVPEIQINQIDMDSFTVGDITVTPILVWHMRMPVLGFRFGNFTYITDANRIDPDEMDKIRGSSHLVLNALRHEKHISHFTLSEAVAVVQELKVPNAYFTHISHQLGLHELINASLPAGIQLAYDGLSIQV
ncbi:MBL fold metallo-hydrolase [Flavihumibacter cheonanensis]|jgi:phosphoribosyl 1,2-cyclic phosphate phosphodiesterase|uniref:MBL fold metallo-hydrolase n=1 Tax=Flavihumibacter cheonanensis TaxID=1442385 RepID=UPI001EF98A11|nr:MBL fold metallo-hydrolase [Flavihumibacter cheonanensis]MCG7753639.1 MBL fold metallo-hydrolase [Flavihumibacter cheonanensis]